MKTKVGQLTLVLVAAIWGTGFVVSAIALDYYTPYQVLAIRFLIAFVLMVLLFFKRISRIKATTLLRGSLLGFLLYLAFAFQTVGLSYTTPAKNAFLTAVNVVLVPFLGVLFFKQRVCAGVYLGAVFALAGIALLSLDGFSGINRGDGLTLVCALCFALQIIFTNRYVSQEDSFALNMVQMGVAAICSLVVLFIGGEAGIGLVSLEGNLAVLYLGGMSTMLAFLLQTIAQKYTTDTEAALILSMEAFFGLLFSVLILHERVSLQMLTGAAAILLGIVIVELGGNKQEGKLSQDNNLRKIENKTRA